MERSKTDLILINITSHNLIRHGFRKYYSYREVQGLVTPFF